MGWPRHHGLDDLDRALRTLPAGHVVTPVGRSRLVLGPSGAHLVVLDDGSDDAARDVARLASVVRSALADHVAWVPYVDAFLVTDHAEPRPPATRVPRELILNSLVEGPTALTPADLDRLVACIADGALDGLGDILPAGGPVRLGAR